MASELWGRCTALATLLLPSRVFAGDAASNPCLAKEWVFDAGAVFQNLDGDLSTTTSTGSGGTYGLSRLGLYDESTSVLLGMRWRFADRWRFDFNFSNVEPDGSRGDSTTIDFGRISIPKGYQVDSSVEAQL